jgi:prepilin-type N-terminal cleavage/methylation domain-containing protein
MSKGTQGVVGAKQGFTLVEVALAMLAVGLGLLCVFALFPAGLQNMVDDVADTRAGLFASVAFNGIRGSAATVTNATTWDAGCPDLPTLPGGVPLKMNTLDSVLWMKPATASASETHGYYIRYRLDVSTVGAGPRPIYAATLTTCDGQYGPFQTQNVFYTEFYYTGN